MATMLEQRSFCIFPEKVDALSAANNSFCNHFTSEDADSGKRRITIELLERQLLGSGYAGDDEVG